MTNTALANYEREQALFAEFVASHTEPNILLFQGESGSGKSHFIEHCLQRVPETPSVLLKLQSGAELLPTLFTRMGGRQGWQHLPNFTHTVATLLEHSGNADDPLWQIGMHRHLGEIGKISDLESRLARYQLLSDAWFADAIQFERPFLLAVDSYESSSTLFDHWFCQDFLVGAAHSQRMRVMVAGQKVPALQEGWRFCASVHKLKGVHEAEAWLAWAGDAGYQVPSLEVMVGVVLALKGNPSQIIEVINTQFPRSNGVIKPKESITERRKQWRKKMTEVFNLSELKDICFDMSINYDDLPGHEKRSDLVRELLAFAERIGSLQELVQVCQQERPHLEW